MKTLTLKTLAVIITAFAAITTLNSCKKEKVTPSGSTTAISGAPVDNFMLANQGVIDGMTSFMASGKNAFKTASGEQAFGSCGTVTYDTTTAPYTITWNFGTGCTGSDGHFRSGIITVTTNSKNIQQAGDTLSVAFNNYVADTLSYAGGFGVVSYTDGSNYLNYALAINATVTLNGVSYPDSGNLNYQWIAGMGSNPLKNLQFSITGSLNGYDSKQSAQDVATITTPLLRNYGKQGCNYIVQGDITLVTNGTQTAVLDFGNGSCTGTYTETINGKTTTRNQ